MKNANPLSGAVLFGCALLAGVMTASWPTASAASEKPAVKTVDDYFLVRVGDKEVRLQFALTSAEQQKGLMYRKELKPNDGMLFVFERPQEMSFYMRNTWVPLHIAYIDVAGVLREIYPMFPHDETPVQSRSRELQFALEMNQDWFSANQIKTGATIDLAAVKAALKARGFDPVKFGFPR